MPVPRHLSTGELDEIFDAYAIEGANRNFLRGWLEELITELRSQLEKGRKALTTKKERAALKNATKKLSQAAKILGQRKEHGQRILKMAAKENLSTMFRLDWLQNLFPGDGLLPEYESIGSPPIRAARSLRSGFDRRTEGDARQARYYFAQQRGAALIVSALREIELSLTDGLERTKLKGGRTPNHGRHMFLINLAFAWSRLGRPFERRSGLSFNTFCEAIFTYVGWPHTGLDDAVDDAVKEIRTRNLVA